MLASVRQITAAFRRRCAAVERLAKSITDVSAILEGTFDHELHFWDPERPELVAQYLLVVDALVRYVGSARHAQAARRPMLHVISKAAISAAWGCLNITTSAAPHRTTASGPTRSSSMSTWREA
jgi:hypothetical protein